VGLILDSSVVIAAERRGNTPEQLAASIFSLAGDQEAAISSIGLTELVHGIYRAESPERRVRRERFIRELRAGFTVYPYTEAVALIAGQIDGEQTASGVIIPFPDLLIGATALSLGYAVLTVNQRHFRLIPGLRVMSL
jgi:predicted nucleic acid-binding protein